MQDELVRQAQRGDAEAFDSLARTVGDRRLAIAVRILCDLDLAEDAVQASLITAWTELRALRDLSRFEPWLNRILTRAAGRHYRLRVCPWRRVATRAPGAGGAGRCDHPVRRRDRCDGR